MDSCTSGIDCLCTNANVKGLAKCFDCVVKIPGSNPDISDAQSALDIKCLSYTQPY
jgi:hypothetical protein